MGIRLLKLFSLLIPEDTGKQTELRKPNEVELKALKYIHSSIYRDKKQPTVRGISKMIGRSSSRSGFRMRQVLLEAGFIHRDRNGNVSMRKDVPGFKEVPRD